MYGRTDGTYSAGVKDSASAYVLCPRLAECGGLSIYGRNGGIVSGVVTQARKQIYRLLGLIEGQVTGGLVRLQASE